MVGHECGTCRFFDTDFIDGEADRESWCLRYPPVFVGRPTDRGGELVSDIDLWQQPTVGIGGTCGEWMASEETWRMDEPITQELRDAIDMMYDGKLLPFTKSALLSVADRIDREHRLRMDGCRRETRRAKKGDAIEVVRCGECRWALPEQSEHDYRAEYYCGMWRADVGADGYCMRGRRRAENG